MTEAQQTGKGLNIFEKYLTLWVILCIIGGIILGKSAPSVASTLDDLAIYVGKAPVVSIPIAVCLFFMMYPIMVKIDFAEVLKAGKSIKPVTDNAVSMWTARGLLTGCGQVARAVAGAAVVHLDLPGRLLRRWWVCL